MTDESLGVKVAEGQRVYQMMVHLGSESFSGNHVSWISVPIDITWKDWGGSVHEAEEASNDADRVCQVEAAANGSTVLGSKRATDHVVGTTTLHVSIGNDGAETQRSERCERFSDQQHADDLKDASLACRPA